MTSPADLHDSLVALLKTIGTVNVFDADVPDKPPADTSGKVFPYVVVWPSAGWYPADEADPLCAQPDGSLVWPVQLTVAAGNPAWVLPAAAAVRAKVAGVHLTSTAGPLREDAGAVNVQKDTDTSPTRWFVPLLYRAQTA